MGYADLPLSELRTYRSEVPRPDDFEEFWQRTLKESRAAGFETRLEPVDNRLTTVDTWDVTFAGFGGQPVKGWLHLPANRGEGPLPGVVEYIGYTGGRGLPHERTTWAQGGYAHFVMDTRGQGGDTDDVAGSVSPSVPGFLTQGWDSPENHYYRRLITDAALAVDAARGLASVDSSQVVVTGVSQGGGLAISGGVLGGAQAVLSDVPFLCDFPRAAWISATSPYDELVRFLARRRERTDRLFETLSYLDAVNFARDGRVPALFSVALMDPTCPPSTVYGAYNAWEGEKSIREYAYNQHEGGQAYQQLEQYDWLRTFFA
ncbi:acetylxylan esterase [Kineosporia rhizophila]|uniref:acetylxylan esterase n=1 Tax=Kineosporia TaxID=49184 RepID=UPI001E53A9F9|nr:acetylxylan esterase [Kineosporia sp. NBRC 101677]MCE0534776.1 acetylxylan esterase [Kineosporia rhizophila]GLY19297.1 acetylxylan esterase [Kineosporia sp. NBRC 101677]